MDSFQIFSDGACDIELEELEKLNVKTIPFYISFNGSDYYKELTELSLDTFFKKVINEHVFPKTSLPSIEDYINAFTPSIKEGKDIICFTITNSLSGSVQSAENAKSILLEDYPDAKIYIINSLLATGAQALLIKEAVKMRDNNYDVDKVYEICEKLKETARIIFMVGTLEHLEKGGRIGKLASLSGSIFNIKPLIILENGEIRVGGVARGRKKGISKLVAICKEHFEKSGESIDDYIFKIGTSNTPDETQVFKTELVNSCGSMNFESDFQIGATISSHTGPDTIGLCFIKAYDKI